VFLIVVFLKIQVLWDMMPKTLLGLLGTCSAGIKLFQNVSNFTSGKDVGKKPLNFLTIGAWHKI
jgi:hypothetical protein